LADELLDRVLDQRRIAVVEETGGDLPQETRALGDLAQQEQTAGVRAQPARTEIRYHRPPSQPLECELLFSTVCPHRAAPPARWILFAQNPLAGWTARCSFQR
jgi:hypothetical protein